MAKELTCGIPQGSCLGPLLLIIFQSDFENCLKFSQPSIYADDKLVFETQQESLNLAEWMRINKLSPNPAKTEYMITGHSRKVNNALMSNDSVIKRVIKTKSLGVTVDENLRWDKHFNTFKGKYVVDLHRQRN